MIHVRLALSFALLLVTVDKASANDIDPCPGKQHEFEQQASTARDAWRQMNAQLTTAEFPAAQLQQAYRQQEIERAIHDLEDTITAANTTKLVDRPVKISKERLRIAATEKVRLSLLRPEGKQAMADAMRQAEDSFHQRKAEELLKLAKQKKDLDDQIGDAHQKLNAACTYDFPSQMTRIVSQVLQLHVAIRDGVLNIASFNGKLPTLKGGQLMLGDHPLMDVPVVSVTGISIGGTNIVPMPTFTGGNLNVPVGPGLPPVKIPLPEVKVGSGPGLGITLGSWHL